jgi:hypothetical protein
VSQDYAGLLKAITFAAHKHRDQRRKDAAASPWRMACRKSTSGCCWRLRWHTSHNPDAVHHVGPLEQLNAEIKRRTKFVSILPNGVCNPALSSLHLSPSGLTDLDHVLGDRRSGYKSLLSDDQSPPIHGIVPP